MKGASLSQEVTGVDTAKLSAHLLTEEQLTCQTKAQKKKTKTTITTTTKKTEPEKRPAMCTHTGSLQLETCCLSFLVHVLIPHEY